ncbi:hypothetical protein DAI22_12g168100 [Oryza sativa Japonica Group]|nr:hypothetical protein DAI22_12g168100 [Oryza sativa Japonica Group]
MIGRHQEAKERSITWRIIQAQISSSIVFANTRCDKISMINNCIFLCHSNEETIPHGGQLRADDTHQTGLASLCSLYQNIMMHTARVKGRLGLWSAWISGDIDGHSDSKDLS